VEGSIWGQIGHLGGWLAASLKRAERSSMPRKATTGAEALVQYDALPGPEGPLFHGDACIREFPQLSAMR